MENPEYREVTLDELRESALNPRTRYNDAELAELTASIKERGVLTPLLVRPIDGHYEIAAGHRRYRAASAAGVARVPVLVRDLSDELFMELLVADNLCRSDLHPLEEAIGYVNLSKLPGYTVERIAERVAKGVHYIYDRMGLVNLTQPLQQAFYDGEITVGHAVLLAHLSPSEQKRVGAANDTYQARGLWTSEYTLFDPAKGEHAGRNHGRKACSVKELKAFIDEHIRFDPSKIDPMLFPQTAAAIEEHADAKLKPISITYEHQVAYDARSKERTYSRRSWQRADGTHGSKTCDWSRLGIVVAGPHRGESLVVCVNRDKCTAHFGADVNAKKKVAAAKASGNESAHERYRREEADRQARIKAAMARWEKAFPAIARAVASAVAKKPLVFLRSRLLAHLHDQKAISPFLAPGNTAESLVRYLVFAEYFEEMDGGHWAVEQFPKMAATSLGVDVKKILDQVAPVEKPAKAATVESKRTPKAKKKPTTRKAQKIKTRGAKPVATIPDSGATRRPKGKAENKRTIAEQLKDEQREKDLAALPGDLPSLLPLYREAITDLHVSLTGHISGDSITAAIDRCELIEAKANGGTTFGMRSIESPAAQLRRLAAAPDGTVPMWGQIGVFQLDVDGVPYLVTCNGNDHFAAHAVDATLPCISESGYRSFFWDTDEVNGATVNEFARRLIRHERDHHVDPLSGKPKRNPMPLPKRVYTLDELQADTPSNGGSTKKHVERPPLQPGDRARCVKCGCTDSRACEGGCSWVYLKKKKREGLCSACATPADVEKYSKFRASTHRLDEATSDA